MRSSGVARLVSQPSLLGGVVLIAAIVLLYWVPILSWSLKYALGGATSLPPDLPLSPLAGRTCLISAVAALASVVAAYPLVLMWRLSGSLAKNVLILLMAIPMLMGFLARNYSWIGMLSSSGPLSSMGWSLLGGTDLLYTELSVYIVMSCIFVPIAFFILIQGASSVSQSHIDAARILGVPDWEIVPIVIIPQTLRAAILAFGLVFAMSTGFFVTPNMIGGGKTDFVSNAILMYVDFGLFGRASALAVAFLALMALPVTIITVFAIRRRVAVTGR